MSTPSEPRNAALSLIWIAESSYPTSLFASRSLNFVSRHDRHRCASSSCQWQARTISDLLLARELRC